MYEPSKFLSKSNEEMDLIIGESLLGEGFGSKPASDSEKLEAAKNWFESNLNRFKNAVCPNPLVREYILGKKNQTRNEIFAAVVDGLLKLGGWGSVPVAVLSARLVNYGLDQLCPLDQEEQEA